MLDPKVTAVLSAKEPRHYQKPDEDYLTAQARWRARYCAYRDAYCMAWCEVYKGMNVFKAFYGVEIEFIEL